MALDHGLAHWRRDPNTDQPEIPPNLLCLCRIEPQPSHIQATYNLVRMIPSFKTISVHDSTIYRFMSAFSN